MGKWWRTRKWRPRLILPVVFESTLESLGRPLATIADRNLAPDGGRRGVTRGAWDRSVGLVRRRGQIRHTTSPAHDNFVNLAQKKMHEKKPFLELQNLQSWERPKKINRKMLQEKKRRKWGKIK